ncbi:MAG: alkaline phosphatase D family protein [Planctomycetes bacterium]|nr:alkaline phosphatase D family protein [Planctomycetota bacterium]
MKQFLVAFSLVLGACSHQAQKSSVELNAGPMLGDITDTSVQIWTSADIPLRFQIQLKTAAGDWRSAPHQPILVLPASDNPRGSVRIDGLHPDTEYEYRLVASDGVVAAKTNQKFKTTGADKFKIAFGSCAGDWGPDPSQSIFKTIAAQHPQWFLWMGDNIYYNRVRQEWNDIKMMRERWSLQRSLPHLQDLLSSTAHAAIWDDHDYGPNDSDKTYVLREQSFELFKSYWPNPYFGSSHDGIYHALHLNGVDVFMLDTRYHRQPNNSSISDKQLLGQRQWRWLKSELLASTAPFKLIVSGMQVVAEYHPYESWNMFGSEKQHLFDFINDSQISGVVLLSGDRHIGEVLRDDKVLGYPLVEFTSSPLAAGVGGGTPDATASRRITGSQITAEHFAMLDFDFSSDDPTLVYSALGKNGEKLGISYSLQASQLKSKQ